MCAQTQKEREWAVYANSKKKKQPKQDKTAAFATFSFHAIRRNVLMC